MAAARYVAMNPVRARLVERAEDWPWSSARAHLAGRDDGLVEVAPLLSRCGGRFADLIADEPAAGAHRRVARRRDDRPPAGSSAVSRPARRDCRARPEAAEARTQAERGR